MILMFVWREIVVPKIAFYMYRKNFECPTEDDLHIEELGLSINGTILKF